MASRTLAGRYERGELLSATRMSEVIVAMDRVLERRVVVKLLAPNADRARFEREANAAAGLAHPNIVQLFDYGHEDGTVYMVLEYLPGGTLAERLKSGRPLPDDEVARIAADVATGLEYAHRNGVVHRDLKPANILFDEEDRAKIGDLGIASVDADTTLTEAGTVLGTAAYISPEQAAGEAATPASDVYSFGVTLFEMLTGRLPFESGHSIEVAAAKQHSDPPSIRSMRPDAPEVLAGVATAALSRRPEDRPQDGAVLAAELAAPASLPPPASVDVSPTEAPTVVVRRRRGRGSPRVLKPLAAGLVLVLLVGAGVVIAGLVTRGHATQAPAATAGATNRKSTTASGRAATSTSRAPTSSTAAATTIQSTRPSPGGSPTTTAATVTTEVTNTAPATSTDDTTGSTSAAATTGP